MKHLMKCLTVALCLCLAESSSATQQTDTAGFHLKVALSAIQNGDLDVALEELNAAEKLTPDDGVVHFMLATILDKKGRTDEAMAELDRIKTVGVPDSYSSKIEDLRASLTYKAKAATKSGQLTSDDLVEIQQLYARHNWMLDSGDAAGYAATFTSDAVFNNNVGHDAIAAFAKTFHAGLGSHVHHWNTNLILRPSAGGASGQVYLLLIDYANKPATIVASATYKDELVRTAEGWRFARRETKGDVAAVPRD